MNYKKFYKIEKNFVRGYIQTENFIYYDNHIKFRGEIMAKIDELLNLTEVVNTRIIANIRKEGEITENVKLARKYFVDAIESMIKKDLDKAELFLKKASSLVEG